LAINLVSILKYVEDKLLYLDNSVISWRGLGLLSDALVEVLTAHPEVLHVHALTAAQHKVQNPNSLKLLINYQRPLQDRISQRELLRRLNRK